MLIKSSLLVLYHRIFRPVKAANLMIWTGAITIVLLYLASIVTTAIVSGSCRHPPTLKDESACGHTMGNLSSAQSIFSILSDIYVLAVPLRFVLTLQLPFRRKMSVFAIFLIGLV